MCGITGFFTENSSIEGRETLKKMTDALSRRGPDGSGYWSDPNHTVFFGHRRLAIIDLSSTGTQPMRSLNHRFHITFNGEIYNYGDLRKKLEAEFAGITFRGSSDTEVFLEYISHFGLQETLIAANGMFAFGLWDNLTKKLFLGRDRFGEKPLYYSRIGNSLVFGSELKSLRMFPGFSTELDPNSVNQFIRYGYVPSPRSIFKQTSKLPAGHFAEIEMHPFSCKIAPYFSFLDLAESSSCRQQKRNESALVEELEALLLDAVKSRCIADVPIGAFLSGGIDSSLIVALMQRLSPNPVKTFTIGFEEKEYDESPSARAIAKILGTEHTELLVSTQMAQTIIRELPNVFDEPFADSSQIPTILVSRMTSQHVKVSLSGDAGDELFGGYNRYLYGQKVHGFISTSPRWLTKTISSSLSAIPNQTWSIFYSQLESIIPRSIKTSQPIVKFEKLRSSLISSDENDLFQGFVSIIKEPNRFLSPEFYSSDELPTNLGTARGISDFTKKMMAVDTMTYLPDDILVKLDRSAMSSSLEGRVPFLDPRVVEFAWRLPTEQKIRRGVTKHILKEILSKYVPRSITERPKTGFGIPIDSWLRTDLKNWMLETLAPEKLKRTGIYQAPKVLELVNEHLAETRNHHFPLWNFLMLETWREQWLPF